MADQISARKKVLSTWFEYRTNLEVNPEKWRGILDESFEFTIPVTPYRSFPPHQVQDGRRKVVGIPAMIYDTLSLHVLVQSMVSPRNATNDPKVVLHYDVSEESIMSDDTCMCKWRIRTENVVARGGLFEIAKQGMLLATFGEDNKLLNVEVSFDVMSFMQQLRRTSEREGFQVVPNITYSVPTVAPSDSQSLSPSSSRSSLSGLATSSTPSLPVGGTGTPGSASFAGSGTNGGRNEALSIFMHASEPRVVTTAAEPYTFNFINKKFLDVFRYDKTAAELLTRTGASIFSTLIPQDINKQQTLDEVRAFLMNLQPCCAVLNCRTGGDTPVVYPSSVCFFPLFADGVVQQYLVTIEVIGEVKGAAGAREDPPPLGQVVSVRIAAAEEERRRDKAGSGSQAGSLHSGRSGSSGGRSSSDHAGSGTGSGSGATDRASHTSSITLGTDASAAANAVAGGANGVSKGQRGGASLTSSLDRSRSSRSGQTSEESGDALNRSTSVRQAAVAMQQSFQQAATERWMQDVSASGPGAAGGAGNRASNKAQREGRTSPEGAVSKTSRTGESSTQHSIGIAAEGEGNSSTMDTHSGSLTNSGTGSGNDSGNDNSSPMHTGTPEGESGSPMQELAGEEEDGEARVSHEGGRGAAADDFDSSAAGSAALDDFLDIASLHSSNL